MTIPSQLSVIIPAAGTGSRMLSDMPKQYFIIAGKTVLEHTLDVFINHPLIDKIVVCLHPNDRVFASLDVAKNTQVFTIGGGKTRAESVLNALFFLHENDHSDWVLVHDAARPGLSQRALDRLISARNKYKAAILALPVVDTIKYAETHSENMSTYISSTIDRRHLWQAQTPQMFNTQRLLTALSQALHKGLTVTDEASAIEYLGDDVALIEGEAANMKITRPEDLALAAFYLQHQSTQRDL